MRPLSILNLHLGDALQNPQGTVGEDNRDDWQDGVYFAAVELLERANRLETRAARARKASPCKP